MRPAARWLIVAAVAVALAAAPPVVRAIPADQSDVSARDLAQRVRTAQDSGWSGEVRTFGSLRIPVGDSGFRDVARLLGQETRLRVWWRGAESWRVDRLRRGGESDLAIAGGLVTRWDSESRKVSVTPYSSLRLPHDVDVLPVTLARRLLAGAGTQELSRLPSLRVAGRSAAGLRLVPTDRRSTVARVDVWADDETGVPLRVEVYGDQVRRAVLVSQVTGFDPETPEVRETSLQLDPGLSFSRGVAFDDAMEQRVLARVALPSDLAGLPRASGASGVSSLGVYGRGPTAFLVIPVRDSLVGDLRDQLRRSSSARIDGRTVALEIGPVSMLLADLGEDSGVLLTGTVTPETLVTAARQLEGSARP